MGFLNMIYLFWVVSLVGIIILDWVIQLFVILFLLVGLQVKFWVSSSVWVCLLVVVVGFFFGFVDVFVYVYIVSIDK